VATIISKVHRHDWSDENCSNEDYSFHRCLKELDDWCNLSDALPIKHVIRKPALYLIPGLPLVYTGLRVYNTTSHRKEMLNDLEYVVREINSIYRQTQTLMIANLLK
jgi:hypothetical protein